MSKDSDDHSYMHRLSDELDALGEQLGVDKVSAFFDFTDLNANMDDEFDGADEDENGESSLDPETGYSYGIDGMQWFDAAKGLATLKSLHASIADGALDLDGDARQELLLELNNCAELLEGPAVRNGKFHLAVVM